MVDGSNESLEHADEEYDPILPEGITLQNSFEKVDVNTVQGRRLVGVVVDWWTLPLSLNWASSFSVYP